MEGVSLVIEGFNIDRRQIHEQIYESLKSAILNGKLKPGEKLNQDDLAKSFGTSRMPIRDALRLLQSDELVDYFPNKGFTVTEFNEEKLKDTLFFRSILEREAVKLAKGRMTPEDIANLERLLEEMAKNIENGNLAEIPPLNYEFHFTIYKTIPSEKMLDTINTLWENFPRYAMFSSIEKALVSQEKHLEIIEAIKKEDYELAGKLMEEHILNTSFF